MQGSPPGRRGLRTAGAQVRRQATRAPSNISEHQACQLAGFARDWPTLGYSGTGNRMGRQQARLT
jgi:hypothetical protein